MLLYDILLYKHAFENVFMYTLCLCCLMFSFPFLFFHLSSPDMICTISTTLYYDFHLSAYFLSSCPGLPALPFKLQHNDAKTIREIYKTYPMTAVPGCGGLQRQVLQFSSPPAMR